MSINQTPDPDAFRDFEHAGWTSNVSEYEAAFARITSQAIGPLLDAVDLRRGARMLDVATGPGYVAAAAAERGARAVGVDFSAPMVARARKIYPAVRELVALVTYQRALGGCRVQHRRTFAAVPSPRHQRRKQPNNAH